MIKAVKKSYSMNLKNKFDIIIFHQKDAILNYSAIRFLFFIYIFFLLLLYKNIWTQFPEKYPYLVSHTGLFALYHFTTPHLIFILNLTCALALLVAFGFGGRIIIALCCAGFFLLNSQPQAYNTLAALNTPISFFSFIFLFSPVCSPLKFIKNRSVVQKYSSSDYSWPIFYGRFLHAFFFFFPAVSKLYSSGISWLRNDTLKFIILCSPFRVGGDNISGDYSLNFVRNFSQNYFMNSNVVFSVAAIIVIMLELLAPVCLFSNKFKKIIIPLLAVFQICIYYSLLIPPFRSIPGYLFWIDWKYILQLFKKNRA